MILDEAGIEAAARVLYETDTPGWPWSDLSMMTQCLYRDRVRVVVSAYTKQVLIRTTNSALAKFHQMCLECTHPAHAHRLSTDDDARNGKPETAILCVQCPDGVCCEPEETSAQQA